MNLSREFWEVQKGLLLIGSDGSLRFTSAGRARYAPILAKYGFSISNASTLNGFIDVMGKVNSRELAENTQRFEEMLADPKISQEERDLIWAVLNREPQGPAAAEPRPLTVVFALQPVALQRAGSHVHDCG